MAVRVICGTVKRGMSQDCAPRGPAARALESGHLRPDRERQDTRDCERRVTLRALPGQGSRSYPRSWLGTDSAQRVSVLRTPRPPRHPRKRPNPYTTVVARKATRWELIDLARIAHHQGRTTDAARLYHAAGVFYAAGTGYAP